MFLIRASIVSRGFSKAGLDLLACSASAKAGQQRSGTANQLAAYLSTIPSTNEQDNSQEIRSTSLAFPLGVEVLNAPFSSDEVTFRQNSRLSRKLQISSLHNDAFLTSSPLFPAHLWSISMINNNSKRNFHNTSLYQTENNDEIKNSKASTQSTSNEKAATATSSTPKAPLYQRIFTSIFWKDLWQSTKDEIHHYKTGFQLMYTDVRVASRLLFRVLKGHSLTRRERRQFIRTASDVFLLVPFSVFIVVPFAELTLPFFIKFFPGMLPSRFQHADTQAEKLRNELKIKLEMAKFLQDTVEEMAAQQKKSTSNSQLSVIEFANFLDNVRTNNLTVSTEEILKYSKLFDNQLTLDNLSRTQIVALCKLLLINSIGTTSFLRFQLRMKLRELKADDDLIQQEGVESLSVPELQQACRERGIRALGISQNDLKARLQNWLDMQSKDNIPTSLMLLSRVLYLPDHLPEAERIAAAVTQLPVAAQQDAKIALAESEGAKLDPATRLAAITKEEQAIKLELLEEAQEQAKNLETEQNQSTRETLKDPAAIQSDAAKITLEDLVDLAMAVVAQDRKADSKALEGLKEDVREHKEDLQGSQGPKASLHLSKRVENMVATLESKLKNIEDIDQKAHDESHIPVFDHDVKITTAQLVEAMKGLKNPPSAAKLEKIASFLDADADGVLNIDVITKVFQLVEAEGEDINPTDLSILVKLIEKENVLSLQEQERAGEQSSPK